MHNSRITLAILSALSTSALSAQSTAGSYRNSALLQQTAPRSLQVSDAIPHPNGTGAVLYDQTKPEYPESVWSIDLSGSNAGFGSLSSYAADDFFIADADIWLVDEVDVDGTFLREPGDIDVAFYSDARGLPASTPRCQYDRLDYYASGDEGTIRRLAIPLPTRCALPPGRAWVSVVGRGNYTYQGGFYWGAFTYDGSLGNEAAWKNPHGGLGVGCLEWTPLRNCQYSSTAFGFKLIGIVDRTNSNAIFTNGFDGSNDLFFNPLGDAGFEQTDGDGGINPYWSSHDANPSAQTGSTVLYSNIAYPIPVYQGQWEIWFGGWSNGQAETQTASQTFTLESGGPRYLHYWRFIQNPPVGSGILTIIMDGAIVSTLNVGTEGADDTFGEHVLDLSSYADSRPHTIGFQYEYAGGGDDGRVFIDWVTVTASATAASSGPPPTPHTYGASKRSGVAGD